MPLENLEEEGLEKIPDLRLAQWVFRAGLSKTTSADKEELQEKIMKVIREERRRRICSQILEVGVSQATETFRDFPCNLIMTSRSSVMHDPAGLQIMHQALPLATVSTIKHRPATMTSPSASYSRPEQVASELDTADKCPRKHIFREAQTINSTEAKRPIPSSRDRQRCCADHHPKHPPALNGVCACTMDPDRKFEIPNNLAKCGIVVHIA
ncbi:hypothetical protein T265_10541 [Opisthorchis viverrini]|uniref:Uncharacterized protein n=1 Tax=Opisthorchis viverrini TaxID=6198 RepID=A0A075A0W3_OPIVI|nr:hypothetical protein T265_10541 [Opisthorchis viverrini]KER21049.1 hypothetical protein T265_10541 [Opisthorchis viverrini]